MGYRAKRINDLIVGRQNIYIRSNQEIQMDYFGNCTGRYEECVEYSATCDDEGK
jgi:hypothetical protein